MLTLKPKRTDAKRQVFTVSEYAGADARDGWSVVVYGPSGATNSEAEAHVAAETLLQSGGKAAKAKPKSKKDKAIAAAKAEIAEMMAKLEALES